MGLSPTRLPFAGSLGAVAFACYPSVAEITAAGDEKGKAPVLGREGIVTVKSFWR